MNDITSSHNETYKHLKQLASSTKRRRLSGETLLEGIHLCQDYLQHGTQPLLCVYTEAATQDAEAASIIAACADSAIPNVLLSEGKFRSISAVENGVGLAFVIAIPSLEAPTTLTDNALLLENVQDPGNMGSILRTAAAAGVEEIFISRDSTSAWSPKTLRAGMGAHTALRIYENCDLAELIRDAQVQVLATSLNATATIYQKDLSRPTAWLFGNEGNGVSDELLALNVNRVIIPQSPGVESLNVAASVAICLFEQVRQVQYNA